MEVIASVIAAKASTRGEIEGHGEGYVRMNWRELSAGRALDKYVAERIGWRIIPSEHVHPSGRPANYVLVDEKGQEIAWLDKSDDDMDRYESPYNAYSTDANAALTLWDSDYHWAVFPDPDQPGKFCATHPCLRDYDVGIETADTAAHAITRSWLAFGDKTNGCLK